MTHNRHVSTFPVHVSMSCLFRQDPAPTWQQERHAHVLRVHLHGWILYPLQHGKLALTPQKRPTLPVPETSQFTLRLMDCFRCVMVQPTVRMPQTNRAVEAGAPGDPGAPARPPVDRAPEAGGGCVPLETLCSSVRGRALRGRSASTPPAQVRAVLSMSRSSVPNASVLHQWTVSGCPGRTGQAVPAVGESR